MTQNKKTDGSFLVRYGPVLVGLFYLLFLSGLLILRNISGQEPARSCRSPSQSPK
ncbi:hypothetical protein HY768_10545 [candidate division TA06 bacterium]|uniref:Uncharacterized protein n=1 Tax=candidate division TA06 bacterium TaxID=2250710 RepID=A0A933IBB0_UNCT6|nr:hypothetical protein [candidate division TA06 bacterium]